MSGRNKDEGNQKEAEVADLLDAVFRRASWPGALDKFARIDTTLLDMQEARIVTLGSNEPVGSLVRGFLFRRVPFLSDSPE
jgi:hypothetical protein